MGERWSPTSQTWQSTLMHQNGDGEQGQRDHNWRCLEQYRDMPSHQLFGAVGGMACHPSPGTGERKSHNPFVDRQQVSCGLHQSHGRNSFQPVSESSHSILVLGTEEGHTADGKAHCRQGQWFCRLDVSCPSRSNRLDAQSGGISENQAVMGPSGSRFICHQTITAASMVLRLETRTSSRESGCIPSRLVSHQRICTPSLVPNIQMSEESMRSTCNTDSNHSTLDSSAMVPNGSYNVNRLPQMSPPGGQSPRGNSKCRPTEHTSTTESGRMAHFRESLADRGISQEVESLLSASWRKGTHKNYDSAWRKWEQWCISHHVSPISASFLGSSVSCWAWLSLLNVYRSAISSIHPKIDGYEVGSHPLVCRLLKGVFNKRPPLPKYWSTWSVESVITYVSSMGPNNTLSLKQSTHKLAILLAPTTASRSSDLCLITVQGCAFVQEGVRCTLSGLSKQGCPRYQKPTLEIAFYRDQKICPVICLQRYIEVTKQFRVKSSNGLQPDQLLIGITKPHAPVQACTVAHWVKTAWRCGYQHDHVHSTFHKKCINFSRCQGELHCKRSCLKQTGHHLVPFKSIISDHSHSQPFHQLSLTKLQTYMLIGTENPPKYKYWMAEVWRTVSYLELHEEGSMWISTCPTVLTP